jgi:predicted amidohydrolase
VIALGQSSATGYTAAYVEYQATSACGQGSCGAKTKALNAQALVSYAKEAAGKGAQIIVFPEYGITGFSSYGKSSWISGGYVEVLPSATGTVPCDGAIGGDGSGAAPTLKTLSCAARENKIVIVANLVDYVQSEDAIYNTDIVLDSDGTFLVKYHKQNLWGEANMDVPKDCPLKSFKTSFGVTFGVITCADLIYKQPALTLLGKGEWGPSAFIDQDLYSYRLVSSTPCTWNPTTRHS